MSPTRQIIALTTIEDGLNRDKGGPTRVIFNLLEECYKKSEQVKLIGIFSKIIVLSNSSKDKKTVHKKLKFIPKFIKKSQLLYLLVAVIRFIIIFSRFIAKYKIDVINAHDVFSAFVVLHLFKKWLKVPLILTIHSKGSWVKREFQGPNIFKKILIHLEKSAVLNADFIVFPSKGAIQYLIEDIPQVLNVIKERSKVIYNGIAIEEVSFDGEWKYGIVDKVLEKIGDNKIILSVTPLVKEKGIDILFNAFLLLNEKIKMKTYLVVVGTGPEYENLKSFLQGSNNILIIEKCSHEEIMKLMKKSTLFVLPHRVSIFDYVLLEAMVSKLPIITTPVGGNLEMFPDKNAVFFVQPENAIALKESIEFLIENENYRRLIADNAYKLVTEKFTLQKMYENYKNIFLNENFRDNSQI